MLSQQRILVLMLLLSSVVSTTANANKKVLSPSQRYARKVKQQRSNYKRQRHLQKNEGNDKNNGGGKEDEEDGGKGNPATTDAPTTDPPTVGPTTAPPTLPPSKSPILPPSEAPILPPSESPVANEAPDDVWTTPAQTTSHKQMDEEIDELRDIQFFGGGEITLRFSLWFQDQTAASQVGGGPTLLAVLNSLHQLLCQADVNSEGDPLGLNALDWADASQVEERELCVVPMELGGAEMRSAAGEVESILLQPPTTYVVDRTASNSDLHWTTWRVTWDVMRLGTFYIAQGIENSGADAASLTEEEIYRAGVSAMQGILELALEVSIREQSLDKMLVGDMVEVAQSEGLVLASVYGEEVQTLQPKLEWLGLAQPNEEDPADPMSLASTQGETDDTTTSTTSDAAPEEDDEWDDDRYSKEYGITEQLDPKFWHPLRIVGIMMFIFTTICLVSLSCLSQRRQKNREMERKMAKEGLLNNPQSVEDMLRASETTRRTTDASPSKPSESHSVSADDSQALKIPMPSTLKVTS